jgi:tetratricopeptide (TPR) repeat protein
MAYFDKAMELLDTLPDTEENRQKRISLLVNADKLFFGLVKVKEYHDLLASYESMLAEVGHLGLRGECYAVLGYCQTTLALYDEAIRTSSRAAELCERAGNKEAAGYAMYISAFAHLFRADYEQALALSEDALRITEEISHARAAVRASWTAGVALVRLGRFDEAIEFGKKARTAEVNEPVMWGWGEALLSGIYAMKRDPDRAIECGESALARAQTPWSKALVQHLFGYAMCYAGRTEEGIGLLEGLLQLSRAMGITGFEIAVTLYLTEGYWLAGQYEEGTKTAEGLLRMAEPRGMRYEVGYAHFFLGEMSVGTDPDEAASHLDKSISVFQEIKAENALAMAYAGFGRLHKKGRADLAREYLTKALEIFERVGTMIEPDKLRAELSRLTN